MGIRTSREPLCSQTCLSVSLLLNPYSMSGLCTNGDVCDFQGNVPLERCRENLQAVWIKTGKQNQILPLGSLSWKKNRLAEARHLGLSAWMETPATAEAAELNRQRAHTPGQETQQLPFLCLQRPACLSPHLKRAQSTRSQADPLPPPVLINVPSTSHRPPSGHTLPPTPPPSSVPSAINREKGI